MAAGRAEQRWRETGEQVRILDRRGRVRWHDAWLGNPAIDMAGPQHIVDGVQARGYIARWDPGPRTIFQPDYRNMDHPGRLVLADDLKTWAQNQHVDDALLIEAGWSPPSSRGKDWGFERWRDVAEQLSEDGAEIVQCGAKRHDRILPQARFIHTPTWRHAAAIIERVAMVYTIEGGTHHMAGALRRPAVVVYSGFVHPETTGYDWHANLYADLDHSPCGRYDACAHCEAAKAEITPDMVVAASIEATARWL